MAISAALIREVVDQWELGEDAYGFTMTDDMLEELSDLVIRTLVVGWKYSGKVAKPVCLFHDAAGVDAEESAILAPDGHVYGHEGGLHVLWLDETHWILSRANNALLPRYSVMRKQGENSEPRALGRLA